MKEVHFRIFELQSHQVLITKDFDDDEDSKPLITVTFFLDNVKVTQKAGYANEEDRDKNFIAFNDEKAQIFLNATMKMLAE